jgi:2-methylisocitrate lyase-like PEP mutase family enzyme
VLYAPWLRTAEEIRAVCGEISKPLNVLALPGMTVSEIAAAGGQRISVGSQLAWVAVAAMAQAAEQMRDAGDFSALNVRAPVKKWFESASSTTPAASRRSPS